ncbi:MAG: DUF401 family protein [Thermotogota bacterium]
MAIISILSGFASMIIAIKLTKKVHWAMLIAILVTSLISMNLGYIFDSAKITATTSNFYEVLGVIFGIYLISDTMRTSGNSEKFAINIKHLFSSKQAVAFMPMFLGLLPMPGGAMFTAPMVKDISEKSEISALNSATMNYWFRHSMEFFWILYPAIVMESALTGISLTKILLIQLPIGVISLVGAWFYFKLGRIRVNHNLENWKHLFVSLFPILTIMIGVIFQLPGYLVVLAVAFIYAIYYKNYKGFLRVKWEILLLLFFVFWYKNFVEISHLSENFVQNLNEIGLSPWLIIIVSPVIIGMITGITQAGFAVTMPITISLIEQGALPLLPATLTTYYFSVIGVLITPVHLCLLLTSEFFGVKISNMVKKMIWPLIFSLIGFLIMFLIVYI